MIVRHCHTGSLRSLATLLAALNAAACSENAVGPDPVSAPACVVSAIVVAPSQASVIVGQATNLTATVSAANCATAPAVTWTSTSAAVSVKASGSSVQVTGMSAGAAVLVTASAGGQSGSALVNVSAPLPTTIVFTAGSGSGRELWRMDPTGANKVQLTSNGVADYSAALSPDGAQIAFIRNGSLYRMASDGTNPTLVTTASGQAITPAWSPDGAQLAYCDFSGDIFTGTCSLRIVTAAGTPVRTLGTSGRYQPYPSWSPDGSSILYADAANPLNCCKIRRSPAAGGATVMVLDTTTAAGNPVYSPDGSRIALHVGYQIAVMSAAGGPLTVLTPDSVFASHPTWSPDGTRIAYEAELPGQTMADIWVMNADGSNKVNITNTPTIDEFQASWGIKVAGALPVAAAPSADRYAQVAVQGPRSIASTRPARLFDGLLSEAGSRR